MAINTRTGIKDTDDVVHVALQSRTWRSKVLDTGTHTHPDEQFSFFFSYRCIPIDIPYDILLYVVGIYNVSLVGFFVRGYRNQVGEGRRACHISNTEFK